MKRISIACVFFGSIPVCFSLYLFVMYMDLMPEHGDFGPPEFDPIGPQSPDESEPNDFVEKRDEKVFLRPERHIDLPIILWWTSLAPSQRRVKKCPSGNSCLITRSRTELTNPDNEVSAIIFYGTDFKIHDLPLPRKQRHMWCLLHEESPKNNWLLVTEEGISLFNITSTFSRYSDYPLHLHFLHTLKRHLLQPIRTPTAQKSQGGLAPVMYMQSGCSNPAARDAYVRNLMKYIDVDSYGKCLHNKALPQKLTDPLTFGSEAILDLVSKYKFVLALENGICHDYLTEKFWRPLYAGTIPIVRGSPTIRDWDPSASHTSIILANDFKSPKELAEYLIRLSQDDASYDKYLSFKKDGVTNKRLLEHYKAREWVVDGESDSGEEGINFIEGFECYICDTLHRRRKTSDHSLRIANTTHYQCASPRSWVEPSDQNSIEKDDMESWLSTEHYSKAVAKKVYEMIGEGVTQEKLLQQMKELNFL